MASRMISQLDNALKNLDSTLTLEIPLEPSGSCSSSPSISLELDGVPLPTSIPEPSISPPSREDLEATTSSGSPPTTVGLPP